MPTRAELDATAIRLMKQAGVSQQEAKKAVKKLKNKAAVTTTIVQLQAAVAQMQSKKTTRQPKKSKPGPQLFKRYYYGVKQQKTAGKPGKTVTAQQVMAMPQYSTKAKIMAKLNKIKPGHGVKKTSKKAVWARSLAQALSKPGTQGKTRLVVDKQRRGKMEPTEAQRKDARRVRALLDKGVIQPQGGIMNPSDFGDKTTADGMIRKSTFKKYINKYKKQVKSAGLSVAPGRVGLKLKKSEMPKKSLKQLAAGLPQGVGRSYYVQKGRTVKRTIGGGGRGAGKIRPIAKGTVSFSKLSTADKKAVAAFLATGQGKVLRGPGARKTIAVQQLLKVNVSKKQLSDMGFTQAGTVKQQPKQQPKKQTAAQIAARYPGREGYRQIVKRAKKQGVSTAGGTKAIAQRLARKQ